MVDCKQGIEARQVWVRLIIKNDMQISVNEWNICAITIADERFASFVLSCEILFCKF